MTTIGWLPNIGDDRRNRVRVSLINQYSYQGTVVYVDGDDFYVKWDEPNARANAKQQKDNLFFL